jgi:hypothetical protein
VRIIFILSIQAFILIKRIIKKINR